MWGKNQKHRSNDEQNQFTAYLVIAVRNYRSSYLKRVTKIRNQELPSGTELPQVGPMEFGSKELADPMQQIGDSRLWNALHQMKSRERYILFSRVLGEKAFGEIAAELNLPYGTVVMSYHRTIKRLRCAMGVEDKQDD